jgi:cell shape-determining protein MreC
MEVHRRLESELDRITQLEARIAELEAENATLKAEASSRRGRKESAA